MNSSDDFCMRGKKSEQPRNYLDRQYEWYFMSGMPRNAKEFAFYCRNNPVQIHKKWTGGSVLDVRHYTMLTPGRKYPKIRVVGLWKRVFFLLPLIYFANPHFRTPLALYKCHASRAVPWKPLQFSRLRIQGRLRDFPWQLQDQPSRTYWISLTISIPFY